MLDEVIQRYEIPTQSCVLTHVTNTCRRSSAARRWTWCSSRSAAPQATNTSFGIDLALLAEARAAALVAEARR